jgi:hypothetical protein
MSKPKNRWLLFAVVVGLLLTYALWPNPVRPAMLSAYSDNAFGMWGLTLFRDGQFDISLPAAQESGRFNLSADTVELLYDAPKAFLPSAYLINRNKKRIDELHRIAGKWTITDNMNWAELRYDSTQFYTR